MDKQARNLLQQLGRTSRAMYAAFEAEVGHALPRWRILQALHEQKSATQKQLAGQLTMDPGALTRQMKSLEAEGLVTRHNAPDDNRLTVVTLTRRGVTTIKALQPLRRTFSQKALKGLPSNQLNIAMLILGELESRFRRMQER